MVGYGHMVDELADRQITTYLTFFRCFGGNVNQGNKTLLLISVVACQSL